MKILPLITGETKCLSQVNRYSRVPVLRQENTAEHQFYVAFYAMLIARDLEKKGYEVDVGLATQKGLMHDQEESISGDIVRSFKHSKPSVKKAIDNAAKEFYRDSLYDNLPELAHDLFQLWQDAKDDTLEGKIVSFADMISVISYCDEEIRKGNTYMYDILDNALDYLETKFKKELAFKSYLNELKVFKTASQAKSLKKVKRFSL